MSVHWPSVSTPAHSAERLETKNFQRSPAPAAAARPPPHEEAEKGKRRKGYEEQKEENERERANGRAVNVADSHVF